MRQLSTNAMLAILEATPELRVAASNRLAGVAPLVDATQLERLTAEGFLTAALVNHREQAAYCIWYHRTVDGGLHINAAVQVADHSPGFDVFEQAVDAIAKRHNCRYIRFNTSRPGLVRQVQGRGYSANSVTMIKNLS